MTTSPSPWPPISPAITTIESAKRIVWFTERRRSRRASGSCTLKSVWQPRGAERLRRLDGVRRNAADPERGDADRGRHGVDERRHDRRAGADREEQHDRHQVREGGHDLHRVEHRRDQPPEAVGAAGEDPEREPDQKRERDGRERERERAHARLPQTHQPERGERGERAEGRAAAAEAEDDEHAERRRAGPGQLEEQARQPADDVVEERRDAVEDAEEDARVRDVPVVREPRLEVVEVVGERVPRDRRRPDELVPPADERDAHADGDERARARRARATTAAAQAPRPAGGLDDRHQSLSPAIAFSTASLSTTPTTRSPSTAQTGRSLPTIVEIARRTVVRTSSRGPSASLGLRLAHDPAKRQHVAARDVAHEVLDVLVGGRADELLRRAELHDRAVAHDRDAVAEPKRLGQVVRDEDHRLAGLVLEADHLVLHVAADERVERAERLVVEHHLRLDGERARETDALLHPARELVGERVARRPRARRGAAPPRRAAGARPSASPWISSPNATLSITRRWASRPKCWKTIDDVWRRIERSSAGARRGDVPPVDLDLRLRSARSGG